MTNANYTALIISMIIGIGLPALVGLITHEKIPSAVKAVLLLTASAITGLLTQWLTALNSNVHFAWQAAVFTALATYVTAVAAHFGLLIPTGVTSFVAAHGVTAPTNDDAVITVTPPVGISGSWQYQPQPIVDQLKTVISVIDAVIADYSKVPDTMAAPEPTYVPPITTLPVSDWTRPANPVMPYINSDIQDVNRSPQVDAEPSESTPLGSGNPRHSASRTPVEDRPVRRPRVRKTVEPEGSSPQITHDDRIARD